jgi:EpsI family protein
MRRLSSWQRFLPALLVIAATSVVIHARNRAERVPHHRDFRLFPMVLGSWAGTDIPLSAEELSVLGTGDFLLRDYQKNRNDVPVNLFLAYYASQRSGDTIHSPRHCLPGSGWTTLKSGQIRMQGTDGSSISVNRYVVGNGADRALVLYWYQSHGHVTSSEYWAKVFLVADAIRMNRTDGALVRVLTSFTNENDEEKAEHRAVEFARQIVPLLDSHIPR